MKNYIKTLSLLIAILMSNFAFAQITINGIAKDQKTKEGLPFAHIGVEGSSTVAVSDFDGVFSITIPKEEMGEILAISVMGYENFEMPIKEVQTKKLKEFLLKSAVFDLVEAVVRSPEKILSDAVDKIEENYWSEDFMLEGFYRKAALEDNKFAYLTEAIVRVYNEGYHKKEDHSVAIEMTHLRASEDFRQIEVYEHQNPLFTGMYTKDKVKTRELKEIIRDAKKNTLADIETSVYNGEDIYIIRVKPYVIYVGLNNDEIYRIDIGNNKDLGHSYQYRKYKGKLYLFYNRRRWLPKRKGKKHGIGNVLVGRYHDRDIRAEAESEVAGTIKRHKNEDASKYFEKEFWKTKAVQKELSQKALEETPIDNIGMIHEFTATKIVLKSEEKYKKKSNINLREDLFRVSVYYDKNFWDNYKLATESKYLQLIRADLEAAGEGKSLEQQFSEVGTKNNEGNRKFRKRMAKESKQ